MAVRSKTAGVDKKTARLLDANLNRAREGIRVVEDTARFAWNDDALYKRLRGLRHRLHEITEKSYRGLVLARDSERDVGRILPEKSRPSVSTLVSANLRRAQEAVRVLEEYSKVFSPRAAAALKAVRFELYRNEKSVLEKL